MPVREKRTPLRNNIQAITKPAIMRLAHQAGIKYFGGLMYEEVRGVMKVMMEKVIHDAIIFMEHGKRRTVHSGDVLLALERQWKKIYPTLKESKVKRCQAGGAPDDADADGPKRKRRRYKPGTVALRMIKKYQKQSDCVQLSKSGFARLAHEIAQDFSNDQVRWSADALGIFQMAVESYLVELLHDTNLATIHAKRMTTAPRDMQLVRRMRQSCPTPSMGTNS